PGLSEAAWATLVSNSAHAGLSRAAAAPISATRAYALGGHIIDDPSDVASLTTLYDELRVQALGCDESLTLLAEFVENTH
ncbi:MAG: hypothetical protein ACRDRC_07870, partial [Pseudonocardiaceae bacterium]